MTNSPPPRPHLVRSLIGRANPIYLRLTGRLSQPQLGVESYIDAPYVKFDPHSIDEDGRTSINLQFVSGDDGVAYTIREANPEDFLLERIAMALTHPAMVREYFQLLKELGLSTDQANDYVAVKQALLKRL